MIYCQLSLYHAECYGVVVNTIALFSRGPQFGSQ